MNTTIGSNKKSNRLGTFGGVFTPSVLTILGVIMFMRAGFVLGQSGILHAHLFEHSRGTVLPNQFCLGESGRKYG